MSLTPADILAHPHVVELLGWPFDFEMDPDIMDSRADITIAGVPSLYSLVHRRSDTSALFVNHECFAGVTGEGDTVECIVHDNGEGIPEDNRCTV